MIKVGEQEVCNMWVLLTRHIRSQSQTIPYESKYTTRHIYNTFISQGNAVNM